MTVINWCLKKIRRACAACKRAICCGVGGGGNDEMDLDHVYHLTVRAGDQNPSVQVQQPVGPLSRRRPDVQASSQQRLRPDVQPMGMCRFADPEKLAAVVKACKELQVPVGEVGTTATQLRRPRKRREPKKKDVDPTRR